MKKPIILILLLFFVVIIKIQAQDYPFVPKDLRLLSFDELMSKGPPDNVEKVYYEDGTKTTFDEALGKIMDGGYTPHMFVDKKGEYKVLVVAKGDMPMPSLPPDVKLAEFYFDDKSTTKDTVFMEGVIYSNTYKDMKKLLQENPNITTLVMVNVPGSMNDPVNLKASRLIRKYNINTYIPENGEVASGGTDMFLAGKVRTAHPTARLGVHSWGGGGGPKKALDYPKNHEVHKKYLEYYKSMGIPTDFYWYTLEAAPAHNIHWMTPDEIKKYKVVTIQR